MRNKLGAALRAAEVARKRANIALAQALVASVGAGAAWAHADSVARRESNCALRDANRCTDELSDDIRRGLRSARGYLSQAAMSGSVGAHAE